MIAHQIHTSPDVFLIRVPFKNFATNETNCYVVRSEGEALVIDVGAPSDDGFEILKNGLAELALDPARTSFFVTHTHLDHIGLLDRIAQPFQKVYLTAREHHVMRLSQVSDWLDMIGDRMVAEGCPDTYGEIARKAHEGDVFDESRHDVALVYPGDALQVGELSLRVVDTAGHTPGQASLYEPESGLLFGGDHILFKLSPGIEFLPGYDDALAQYFSSLQRVRSIHPVALLHSHGPLRKGVRDRIDYLSAHHRERLHEALRNITAHPGMTGEETVRSLTWNVPHDAWEDIDIRQRRYISSEGIVYLSYLRASHAVAREMKDGVARYYPNR